jgi:FkbM family methyltransferase
MNRKIKLLMKVTKELELTSVIRYLMDYIGLIKNSYQIYFKNGTNFTLRGGTADRTALNEVWFHNLYTPLGFEITKDNIIIDVGGHIGTFSVYASQLGAKVYTFEPEKNNYDILWDNLNKNYNGKVETFNLALSNKNNKLREFIIQDGKYNGSHSFYNLSDLNNLNKTFVKTISLNRFVMDKNIKRIDFLKLDCEGEEYKIIMTCPNKLFNIIDKIVIEYHNIKGLPTPKELKEFLILKGYNVTEDEAWGYLYAKKN